MRASILAHDFGVVRHQTLRRTSVHGARSVRDDESLVRPELGPVRVQLIDKERGTYTKKDNHTKRGRDTSSDNVQDDPGVCYGHNILESTIVTYMAGLLLVPLEG